MDIYFNSSKIRFELLDQLTKPLFATKPIRTLNVFINLDNLFSRLKNSRINQEFQACGAGAPKQFISNVFNLIAHYRQWAVRRRCDVKVYAYYTSSESAFENRVFIRNYREYYAKKCDLAAADYFYVNYCINNSDSLMKVISKYIDGIYIVDSKIVEPGAVPCFISRKVRDADWNIVISRDDYDLQYCLMEKFTVIFPRGELSQVITQDNLWDYICEREKITCPNKNKFPPNLFLLAYAVTGDKRRSVQKVKSIGWRTLFDILNAIGEESDDYSVISMTNKFIDTLNKKHLPINDINNNMVVLNSSMNVDNMRLASQEMLTSQLVDVPDYENLYQLNRDPSMFLNFPLNLKFLTDEGREQNIINPFKR